MRRRACIGDTRVVMNVMWCDACDMMHVLTFMCVHTNDVVDV